MSPIPATIHPVGAVASVVTAALRVPLLARNHMAICPEVLLRHIKFTCPGLGVPIAWLLPPIAAYGEPSFPHMV